MNKEEQKTELDQCLNGCTINGKKLTGRHYFYLNYVKIDGESPEYKAKDDYFFRLLENSFNNINGFKPLRIFWPVKHDRKHGYGMIFRK